MIKKCICLCLVSVLMCFCAIDSYAYVVPEGGYTNYNKEWDTQVKYWNQGVVPNDNSIISPSSGVSKTIGAAACSNFSMACCLVKMGLLDPSKENPVTLIREADKGGTKKISFYLTGTTGTGVDVGYGFDYTRISELYPDVTYEGRDFTITTGDLNTFKTFVKGKMNEGYFIIANMWANGMPSNGGYGTQGHFCFLDGFDDSGKLVIGDSWAKGLTWDDTYGKASSWGIKSLVYFKLKNKTPADCSSIYGDYESSGNEHKNNENKSENKTANKSAKENLTMTSDEKEKYFELVNEWELNGMPSKDLSNVEKSEPLYFKGNEDLSVSEKDVVASIQEDKDNDAFSIVKVVNGIIVAIGLFIIIYSILLLACYIFDTINPFTDISAVKLITLGHINIVSSKGDYDFTSVSDKKKKKSYVSNKKILAIIIIIFIIGCLFVSGTILKLISSIIGGVYK